MPIDSASSDNQLSWVEAANAPGNGFPPASLPYCAFVAPDGAQHIGVGIGDCVLDLRAVAEANLLADTRLNPELRSACAALNLNAIMMAGAENWATLRSTLTRLLSGDADAATQEALRPMLFPVGDLRFALPVDVTDYTDFYASREHALNVGKLFRPDQPLLPNYDWVPIGYHGRASSIVASGTSVRRPLGQRLVLGSKAPLFGPSRQLDYELEVAAYVGVGNALGEPIPVAIAEEHIFGYTLLNDWSARDIQSWEYQPLGPFLGKSFATSVSPWVIPSAALKPYRVPSRERGADESQPLQYLAEAHDVQRALDIEVEAWLLTARMRQGNEEPVRLSHANTRKLYWTFPQMLAHHTSNGCNLRVGNLIASGTVSGGTPGSEGCLLELTRRGIEPVTLPNGEQRGFLEDGDEVILRGYCEREGLPRISFGECRGVVLPARAI